ncbi:hypothetical protein CS022_15705 [Veronia nyctiphanis]|uniref:Uncharacterized protein n=1 Tax=Veronia nyctiphanis TaxID=1278244 RepID=A0A4Q0YPF7_9GAMM|nr:hypothetical protein [Veronia nyctiphanis]RXJ72395.1 hypothetical protein CS022_15705 [Veronia nyctiphanis]
MKEINNLINKVLLIGISLVDDEENAIERIQIFGPIICVNAEGIVIRRNDTHTEFKIPPDFESLLPAAAGEYHLNTSGEIVTDPDYLCSWVIYGGEDPETGKYTLFDYSASAEVV